MKLPAIIFLVVCLASQVLAQSLEADFSEIETKQKLVSRIATLSQSADYETIYDLLGTVYQGRMTKAAFLQTSNETKWHLTKLRTGTIQIGSHTAYCPVRGIVTVKDRDLDIDDVIFLVKEEKGWRLQNFPFLPEHMPNFIVTPEWLK